MKCRFYVPFCIWCSLIMQVSPFFCIAGNSNDFSGISCVTATISNEVSYFEATEIERDLELARQEGLNNLRTFGAIYLKAIHDSGNKSNQSETKAYFEDIYGDAINHFCKSANIKGIIDNRIIFEAKIMAYAMGFGISFIDLKFPKFDLTSSMDAIKRFQKNSSISVTVTSLFSVESVWINVGFDTFITNAYMADLDRQIAAIEKATTVAILEAPYTTVSGKELNFEEFGVISSLLNNSRTIITSPRVTPKPLQGSFYFKTYIKNERSEIELHAQDWNVRLRGHFNQMRSVSLNISNAIFLLDV